MTIVGLDIVLQSDGYESPSRNVGVVLRDLRSLRPNSQSFSLVRGRSGAVAAAGVELFDRTSQSDRFQGDVGVAPSVKRRYLL